MAVTLLTYSNINYYKSQLISKKAALKNGVDNVVMLNNKWLLKQTDFYNQNKHILQQPRGAGYWLWKPYIILQALKQLNQGDILFYLDSGIEIIQHISPLIAIAEEKNIVLFRNHSFTNSAWTKRDCFYYMDCDSPQYYNGPQTIGGVILLKNTPENIDLITQWLHYGSNRHIITDEPNVCGLDNLPDFIEHRHDQAILSLLTIKNKIELFRDPSQFGDAPTAQQANSPYPALIDIHRGKYPMLFADYVRYYYTNNEYFKLAKYIAARAYGTFKR